MQADSAIQALNSSPVGNSQLVVKFADADVQPRVESGRQPSEWWCALSRRRRLVPSLLPLLPPLLLHPVSSRGQSLAASSCACLRAAYPPRRRSCRRCFSPLARHPLEHPSPPTLVALLQLLPQSTAHILAAGSGGDVCALRHRAGDPCVSWRLGRCQPLPVINLAACRPPSSLLHPPLPL